MQKENSHTIIHSFNVYITQIRESSPLYTKLYLQCNKNVKSARKVPDTAISLSKTAKKHCPPPFPNQQVCAIMYDSREVSGLCCTFSTDEEM